jgi:O-antigen/teichoic acid export membrane protein
MIIGRSYWILIWYGILTLGVVGLFAALYWARQTQGKNLDEILRAAGTIAISIGMLLLLNGIDGVVAQGLLVGALVSFVAAFVVGRRSDLPRPVPNSEDDDEAE